MRKFKIDDVVPALKTIQSIVEKEDKKQPVRKNKVRKHQNLKITNKSTDYASIIAELALIAENTPATRGPGFFNQLFGGRDGIAILGDCVSSYLNNSMYTEKVAGELIDIEKILISKMSKRIGFKTETGTFTAGGSISNMMGLILARQSKFPEIKEDGNPTGSKMKVYTSEESHYSIKKNAGIIGIGRNNVRLIKTDSRGRMLTGELEKTIQTDIAHGATPIMINATAGTTIRGAFDNIPDIADISEKYNIWLHIDGAFGGSLILSDDFKHLLSGTERCQSMTWDAHKLMGVPLICSAFLVKDEKLLLDAINESADYLYQKGGIEPGMKSIQCGRRNDALKLWCAWKMKGNSGYNSEFHQLYNLTQFAIQQIEKSKILHLTYMPESLNVCFSVHGFESKRMCDLLESKGTALIGYGKIKDKESIRLSIVNPEIKEDDIKNLITAIERIALAETTSLDYERESR